MIQTCDFIQNFGIKSIYLTQNSIKMKIWNYLGDDFFLRWFDQQILNHKNHPYLLMILKTLNLTWYSLDSC